jgi:hypothetical protein
VSRVKLCGMALVSGLAMLVVLTGACGSAWADNISIGINTPSASFGLNVGAAPPPLVVVPGTSVYQAPSVEHNYFVYRSHYYLFHDGVWFSSAHHNGPWGRLAAHQVPKPILAVPVKYYRIPPGHMKHMDREDRHDGREHEREKERHGHGHDKHHGDKD